MNAPSCVSSNAVLRKADGLIEAAFDDSLILLSMKRSKYYGGDNVTSDVWRKFDGKRSIMAIATELAGEYSASVQEIAHDLCAFAEELMTEGLLQVVDKDPTQKSL